MRKTYDFFPRPMRWAGLACLVLLFLLAPAASAVTYNAHPRIWLTPTVLNMLRAKMAANDPDWLSLKADADSYVTQTVVPWAQSGCGTNQICYTYEGSGWLIPIQTLGLAYQVTGNVAYAQKVIQI